jgi:hypothetical protein
LIITCHVAVALELRSTINLDNSGVGWCNYLPCPENRDLILDFRWILRAYLFLALVEVGVEVALTYSSSESSGISGVGILNCRG